MLLSPFSLLTGVARVGPEGDGEEAARKEVRSLAIDQLASSVLTVRSQPPYNAGERSERSLFDIDHGHF